jgi:hypothetical protein
MTANHRTDGTFRGEEDAPGNVEVPVDDVLTPAVRTLRDTLGGYLPH